MSKKLDTKEFIRRAKEIHGNKFGYSHVDYVNTHTKVKIKCKIHGLFHQRPSTHIDSSGCTTGCTKCGIKLRSERKRKTTQKESLSGVRIEWCLFICCRCVSMFGFALWVVSG